MTADRHQRARRNSGIAASLVVLGLGAGGCGNVHRSGFAQHPQTTNPTGLDRVIAQVARLGKPPSADALPKGWRQFTNAPALLNRRGTQAYTIITSWAYRPNSRGPVGSMPPQGILITVNLTRFAWAKSRRPNLCENTPRWPGYPPRKPPLHLASAAAAGGMDYEPGVLEYRTFGRFRDDYNFEVRADIKTRQPRDDLWRKAAAVVAQIKLPRWPHRSSCR